MATRVEHSFGMHPFGDFRYKRLIDRCKVFRALPHAAFQFLVHSRELLFVSAALMEVPDWCPNDHQTEHPVAHNHPQGNVEDIRTLWDPSDREYATDACHYERK